MDKQDINTILLANTYLVTCKLNKDCCNNRKELARKYLSNTINKALKSRKKEPTTIFKALLSTIMIILGFNL